MLKTVEDYNREYANSTGGWSILDELHFLHHAVVDHGMVIRGRTKTINGVEILQGWLKTCDIRVWDFRDPIKDLDDLKVVARANLDRLISA